MHELPRRHFSRIDRGLVILKLCELRGGFLLGRGRKRVHELRGWHVLVVGRHVIVCELRGGHHLDGGVERVYGVPRGNLPAVHRGLGMPDVRRRNVLGSGRVGVH